jgi:ABC-type sugar transport system ATPase subunit
MEGRIAQVGTPREVFSMPMTMAVAGFVGTPQMNFMPGTWEGSSVAVDGHPLPVGKSAPARRDVMLGVRPNDLMLAGNGLPARIERIEDLGDSAIISVTSDGKRFKLKGPAQPQAKPGDDVLVSFAPDAAHLFDPQSGERL